ncbi:hypothetical protein WICMUC_005978 [Wickerhamomyces mucosus]|uniref:AMP-dependent synthetase/ligase domain-containing protein n=1 Tax=Wickerhamomyces mucosus TaxID=1378264 RepID=A0A9P8P1F1_9ASCO|nr:hypothetical protein WICMUC_005978 [Wickerhamomyces mucosus]
MSVLPLKEYIGSEEELTKSQAYEHSPFPFSATDYSVQIHDNDNTNELEESEFSPIFRNNATQKALASFVHKDLPTFYHLFEHSIKLYSTDGSIGYREFNKSTNKFNDYYSWESYEQLGEKRTQVGSGILNVLEKYAPDVDTNNFILTLFSANTPQWIITDLACHAYSIPNSPLYDTLGANSTEYILKLTESPIILLSSNKVDKILQVESSFLKILITIEDLTSELREKVESKGYKIFDFKTILEIGAENIKPHRIPTPETLYTIAFTSGTTGIPKGVELTHGNIVAAATFLFAHIDFPKNPTSLVFLPLAHVYERFKINFELSRGGHIGFPHNPENVKTFLDDIKILKPSHVSSVPRLYNRIEGGLKDKIKNKPGFAGYILRAAIDYKLNNENGYISSLVDSYIISKIRKEIGFENLSFLISGGSPLSENSIVYLRKVLNCGFYQGYGSSETFGAIAITTNHAEDPSTTGSIGVTTEFKLRNLPELNYTYNSNKSGELLLRGPQIFHGYFKNQEATQSSLSEDGWFSTGDIVNLNEKNQLKVIDRVKNFFKLSQGEYIASEKIENIYVSNNSYINQFFIYGDSFQNFIIGILGIEEELFFRYISNNFPGKKFSTREQLLLHLNDLELKKWILKDLKAPGLFSFEKIKNIIIKLEPFSINDETLTPTLKLKRKNAQNKYQKEIDELYEQGPIV